jgi:hypothetical protein
MLSRRYDSKGMRFGVDISSSNGTTMQSEISETDAATVVVVVEWSMILAVPFSLAQ